jgi:group I intron endonuclease
MKTFVVYLVINWITGNRYIGATGRGLATRRKQHFQDAKAKRPGCRVFNAAIRKHGADAFEWKVLAAFSSREEMMAAEIKFIAEMKPEYNITIGGEGVIGWPRTPEWKAKISAANRGRKLSPERIAVMRLMDRSHLFKSIVCLNDGRWFSSVKAAANYYGTTGTGVSQVLTGAQINTHGYSFVSSKKRLSTKDRLALLADTKERKRKHNYRLGVTRRRPVVCLVDGKEFASGLAAAKFYSIAPMRVVQLCQDGGSTLSGLSFRYADSVAVQKRQRTEAEIARQRTRTSLLRSKMNVRKPIICIDTGHHFESVKDAAQAYGLKAVNLYSAIDRKQRCSWLTFVAASNAATKILSKPVLCETYGLKFSNAKAASNEFCIPRSLINAVAGGQKKSCYGLKFSYIGGA